MQQCSGHSTHLSGRGAQRFKALVGAAMVQAVALGAAQAPVNLGAAGDFVILAKTGISTTGATHIHGNIGVSPAAATSITGFGLIADPSGTFSTSTLVTGRVYAADYTVPAPTAMTAAISDMETAYTDAAGRTTPDYTELYAGDITGKTLTPGLYKWGTDVLVSTDGFTISGSPTDIWIFQIDGNLTVSNAAIVTLAGGAQARNIFWQVAGQITIGTTAEMTGILLCQTLIDMQEGSTLNGKALSQTAVTTNARSVLLPDPTTLSFTSAQTAFATSGTPFAYAITYHNPGNSADLRDTVLSKPSWVVVENDSIQGIPPYVNRADTVRVMIGSGTDSDTLTLIIHIANATSVTSGSSARGEEYFGRIKGNQIGVNAGAYEVSVYTLAGRGVFHQKASARAGYVTLDLAANTRTVFVVKLTQGNRSTVSTVQVVR